MVADQIDAAHELEASLRLLAARVSLALPTAIASLGIAALLFFAIGAIVVAVVAALLTGHGAVALAALSAGAATLAGCIVAIVALAWFAQAVVVAAAADAWEGHEPNFRAAVGLALRRLPALVGAFIVIAALYVIPVALSLVLIGIPMMIVLGYLLMYVLPAIVIDGEHPFAAIATSFRLTTTQAGPSLIAFAGLIAAFVAGRIADAFTVHVPVIGLVSAFVIGGATAAYGTLVKVRFYALLRDRVADVVKLPA